MEVNQVDLKKAKKMIDEDYQRRWREEALCIDLWHQFWDQISTKIVSILGIGSSELYKVRTKVIAYNTLELGVSPPQGGLIARPGPGPAPGPAGTGWQEFEKDLIYNYPKECTKGHLAMIGKSWLDLFIHYDSVRETKLAFMSSIVPSESHITPDKAIKTRYSYFGKGKEKSIGEGLCLSATKIYEWVKSSSPLLQKRQPPSGRSNVKGPVLEAFAGLPNRNLHSWCSLFEGDEFHPGTPNPPDGGYQGSFFALSKEQRKGWKLVISNPPYLTPIMERASTQLVEMASRGTESISIIPDWRDSRGKKPYPSFDILSKSPLYQGTIEAILKFENLLSGGTKTLNDTKIIVVVLGSKEMFRDLKRYLE
jgi:hypothetical protein